MIPAPPPATSASTTTATTSSGGGAVRLARLGHPYLGLEAFATVGLRHGKRCGKDILTGSPGRDRGCAARNGAQLGSSHATCYEQIDGDHDSGQRWATVRELREAYEGNGAKRFDKVRTPPVETTHRRGGPGRATSANGRGRGSAGLGKRAMREKALNAEERASRSVSMAMHEGPEGKPPAPAGTRRACACHGRIRRASCWRSAFFHYIPYTTHYTHTHPLITPPHTAL